MQAGDRVRLKDNPSRMGVLTSDAPIGEGRREKRIVQFPDGEESVLAGSLERVELETRDPFLLMQKGQYAGVQDLRGAITYYRLSGKLANLIYSLNTTNTKFLPYQFKPVLQYLDSPSRGLVIADEVGLGKTIEAGLIWTELRARQDARRLLVVCPAMLREKWVNELHNRFGVNAHMANAQELLTELQLASADPYREFALVVSMQGTRSPRGWDDEKSPSTSAAAELARFLDEKGLGIDETLIDLVVVDEAHYLRNEGTQTHRLGKLLRPVADGMVLLTATPIQMRSTDLFNLLHLLDEDAFPHEWTYDQSVRANAPLMALVDGLRQGAVTAEEFKQALSTSKALRWLESSEQIEHLMTHLPSDEQLQSPKGRAEYADIVDKLNPRSKVVTRTLKRDVQELRVQREPVTLQVKMNEVEKEFYEAVTDAVRSFCMRADVSEGFLLTIPQRQMSSSMAAACGSWCHREMSQPAYDDEILFELVGNGDLQDVTVASAKGGSGQGGLMQTLRQMAGKHGLASKLANHDSKFDQLIKSLKSYWRDNPGKKVILFAFYKATLYHLQRRLTAQGISTAVLHGGMDKQAVLESFESDAGAQILLSSEVASEGVDLQFSSLLVNYDLPWNPAKIEQRIGRIDRIGQEAPKILIWNLVYADTLDERVYERLLSRLNIFRTALGSMEEILGAEVRKLTSDLLSHKLSADDELRRIDQTMVALERQKLDQQELDDKAIQLLGHGDFIQNKAKAAFDLGRYIRGEDLYFYVKDYMEETFQGTRVLVNDEPVRKGTIELSVEARVAFDAFLREYKLLGRTTLLSPAPNTIWFDNQAGISPRGVEKVTQEHPLVRFISERQKSSAQGGIYFSTSALEVPLGAAHGVLSGVYVYAIMRWTFTGPRDVERLVYEVRDLATGEPLEEDLAEAFVNAAVLVGTDWYASAKNTLDHQKVAALQDDCRDSIEQRFNSSTAMQERANRDRIREMVAAIEQDMMRKREGIEEFLNRHEGSSSPRYKGLITIRKNKLKALEEKFHEKKLALAQMAGVDPRKKDVSSGVIKVV